MTTIWPLPKLEVRDLISIDESRPVALLTGDRSWAAVSPLVNLPLVVQAEPYRIEADYLDTSRNVLLENGGRIIDGVELDVLGRRVAYWLYQEHPGAQLFGTSLASRRVPADGVLHVPAQAAAHVARDLDALVGFHAELLHDGAMAVVGGGLSHGNLQQIMTRARETSR